MRFIEYLCEEAARNVIGAKWTDGNGNVFTLRVNGNTGKISLAGPNQIAHSLSTVMFMHHGIGHEAQTKKLRDAIREDMPTNDYDLVDTLKKVTQIKDWKPAGKK